MGFAVISSRVWLSMSEQLCGLHTSLSSRYLHVLVQAGLLSNLMCHAVPCRAVPCRASVHGSHAIVSSAVGPEYYVGITSFVDKTQLEPGCSVLLHNKVIAG